MSRRKAKEWLAKYYQDTDGNWVKRDTPTEGYGTPLMSMPIEINTAMYFLKELLK